MEAVANIDVHIMSPLCFLVLSGISNLDCLCTLSTLNSNLILALVLSILTLIIGLTSYYSSFYTQRTLAETTELSLANVFRTFGPHFR